MSPTKLGGSVKWALSHNAEWVALALILAGLAVNGILVNVGTNKVTSAEHALLATQRASCLGGSTRQTEQLLIDWTIYKADTISAATTTGEPHRVRLAEAKGILAGMKIIASQRIPVFVARYLPPPLAAVVRQRDFKCPK